MDLLAIPYIPKYPKILSMSFFHHTIQRFLRLAPSITSRGVIFMSCSSSTTSAAGSGGLLLENFPRHPRPELRTLPKAKAILGIAAGSGGLEVTGWK